MGMPLKFWAELKEEIKPFVIKCKEGEITFTEYLKIEKDIYNKFLEKNEDEYINE